MYLRREAGFTDDAGEAASKSALVACCLRTAGLLISAIGRMSPADEAAGLVFDLWCKACGHVDDLTPGIEGDAEDLAHKAAAICSVLFDLCRELTARGFWATASAAVGVARVLFKVSRWASVQASRWDTLSCLQWVGFGGLQDFRSDVRALVETCASDLSEFAAGVFQALLWDCEVRCDWRMSNV